jgi:hypothetical protein
MAKKLCALGTMSVHKPFIRDYLILEPVIELNWQLLKFRS